MTSAHFFFIPLMIFVGLVLGVALGRRSAFLQVEEEARLRALKAKREEKQRLARQQAGGHPDGPSGDGREASAATIAAEDG